MKLLVSLCKHCTVGRANCPHYQELHKQTLKITSEGVLRHHCPVYNKVLPNGTRVRVAIKEIEMVGDYEENGIKIAEYPDWVELGEFEGVVDNPTNRKGFYRIKLDHPQNVKWPDGDDWHNPKTIEITHIHKRLNELKTMTVAYKLSGTRGL